MTRGSLRQWMNCSFSCPRAQAPRGGGRAWGFTLLIIVGQSLFAADRNRYAVEVEAGGVVGLANSSVKDKGKSGGTAGAMVRFDRSKNWETGFSYNVLSLQNGYRLKPATLVGDRILRPRGPWSPYARIGGGLGSDQSSGALRRLVGRAGIGAKRSIRPAWDAGFKTELWYSPGSGEESQDMFLVTAGITLSRSFARAPPKPKQLNPAKPEAPGGIQEEPLAQNPAVAPLVPLAVGGDNVSSSKRPGKSSNDKNQQRPKTIGVLFPTEEWRLEKSDFRTKIKELQKAGDYMAAHGSSSAEIHGHADSRGPLGYNIALSRKRATALRDLFVDRWKLSRTRFGIFAHGSKKPAASNATPQGRAKNRRAVVIVIPNTR